MDSLYEYKTDSTHSSSESNNFTAKGSLNQSFCGFAEFLHLHRFALVEIQLQYQSFMAHKQIQVQM